MFDILDPFQYLSWRENDIDSKIIDFVQDNKFRKVHRSVVDEFLNDNNICYYELSTFAKNKLDEIEIF